jgi:fatty acid desaturase
MHGTSASPQRLNAAQRSAHIREVVLAKGVELRQRYPILNHQDALGVGILAFALAAMVGSAALYMTGHMAWWVCLLLNAFFASLTHELEHDLIHSMYFRKQRVPHNLMMGLVWLARPSTINPWIRRHLPGCTDRMVGDHLVGDAGDRYRRGSDHRTERVAYFLPALRQLQHALLR